MGIEAARDIWHPAHPVKRVLRERRRDKSRPGARTDGLKVGLAVEGGGLRGVVSAAMLCALEDLGLSDCFDVVYACSSGAVNASYFLLGDTWFPLNIYFDDLTSRRFLDFRRVLGDAPIMDLDYVYDYVLTERKPLDYTAIRTGDRPLHVMVTDVDRQERVDAHSFASDGDLRDALRASTWLPLATRGTATFRGRPSIDGGVVRFHPFTAAVEDGCSHVLSLSTKPIVDGTRSVSRTNRHLVRPRLNKLRPGLGDRFVACLENDVLVDKPALNTGRRDVDASPSVLDLAPLPGATEIKRHETRRGQLIAGAGDAYAIPYAVLEELEVEPVIRFMPIHGARHVQHS